MLVAMAFGWALLTFGLWVAAVWLIEGDDMDNSMERPRSRREVR